VLLVRLGEQPFAVPLSMVREILPIEPRRCRKWAARRPGRARRGAAGDRAVAPARLAAAADARVRRADADAERSFILAVDSFAGRDDAVIKSLDDFRPRAWPA
jgi:two-component system chemotaxis sensor kinase CheA